MPLLQVAQLCGGHKVYQAHEFKMVAVTDPAAGQSAADVANERRYQKLLLQLLETTARNFYFSYTYQLASTLQQNCTQQAWPPEPPPPSSSSSSASSGECAPPSPPPPPSSWSPKDAGAALYDNMFVWNGHLSRPLREALRSSRWTVPLVHGFLEQRTFSVFGRPLTLTLIARRSRHFAGTRYKKRGLNDAGHVANEVETEQILDGGPCWRRVGGVRQLLLCSVVQLRGSVPLYWSQQLTTLSPKPEVVLQHFDPLYQVTGRHFDDLRCRYGSPVVALNLLKTTERKKLREALLSNEMSAAIRLLNEQVTCGCWPGLFGRFGHGPT